jgi:hypothetical protein
MRSRRMEEIWGAKLPLKIRIFLWQVVHDRLESAEQLKKREWNGEIECQLCGRMESIDHILFRCVCSWYVWTVIQETFGWSHTPSLVVDFMEGWCGVNNSRDRNKLLLFGCDVVC